MTRETQDLWSKRIERWKDSGLTAAEYAQETGLNRHTLAYWNWRLKTQGQSTTKRSEKETPIPPRFVEVAVTMPEPAADPGPLR
jgi:hypothetical protein